MANSEVKAAGVFAETPLLEMSPHKKLMLIGSHLVLCEVRDHLCRIIPATTPKGLPG